MNEEVSSSGTESLPLTGKVKKTYLRVFLKAAGFGSGVTIALAFIVWGFIWYSSRPKPPKAWNTKAITAEYLYIDTFGNENHMQFCYVLQNNTAYDYTLTSDVVSHLGAKLKLEKGFSESSDFLSGVYPAFIPAKQRGRFCLHVEYPSSVVEPSKPTDDQRKAFRRDIENFASNEFKNLDGFELFDSTNRYEILFSAGWRNKSNSK